MKLGAIEAGGTKFVVCIGDESGNVIERATFPTETPEKTMANVFKFFENGFTPLFGALTFPMAIGTLAGYRAGAFFTSIEAYKTLGILATNVTGFQLLISSTFMCFVFL